MARVESTRRGAAEPRNGSGAPADGRSGDGALLLSANRLLGSPVELGRVRLGLVRDVLFGADLGVVLGLPVETRAGKQCFLPWAGVEPAPGSVVVSAPTLLLGEVELAYYVASGIRLAEVIDADLDPDGREALVRDVTLRADGTTVDLIVSHGGDGTRAVAVGDVRVHWSAGQAPRFALGSGRGRRRLAGAATLAFATRGRAA
jgi:hypothetical protein